jgi:serine/threonine-protein kinase
MAREREILASLEHPGIARLYDAGVTDSGGPYLALEYVEGTPLDRYCGEGRLGVRARLELFLKVCDAVAYAHRKLIVHRDLKPANILVTPSGDARLLDFGIGKLLDDQQPQGGSLTEVAGHAFTPDYASPEQIGRLPLTVGTDIYSLGVILYELLTGRRPYRLKRDSRGALEDAILDADPRPPSQAAEARALHRALRGDLDAIVLKALKKVPSERYPTVESFADDVQRYLDARPVMARADGRGYRIRKFLARHRLAAATAAVAGAAVIAGAGIALWQADVAREEARRAERVTGFIASIFQGVDPNLLGAARPLTATEVLDQAAERVTTELSGQPELQLRLRTVIARSYLGLYEPARARELLKSALAAAQAVPQLETQALQSLHLLTAQALLELTQLDDAERHLAVVLDGLSGRPPGEPTWPPRWPRAPSPTGAASTTVRRTPARRRWRPPISSLTYTPNCAWTCTRQSARPRACSARWRHRWSTIAARSSWPCRPSAATAIIRRCSRASTTTPPR